MERKSKIPAMQEEDLVRAQKIWQQIDKNGKTAKELRIACGISVSGLLPGLVKKGILRAESVKQIGNGRNLWRYFRKNRRVRVLFPDGKRKNRPIVDLNDPTSSKHHAVFKSC